MIDNYKIIDILYSHLNLVSADASNFGSHLWIEESDLCSKYGISLNNIFRYLINKYSDSTLHKYIHQYFQKKEDVIFFINKIIEERENKIDFIIND